MLTYTKKEIMSSTEVVRNFKSLLDSIKTKKRDKVAIMRQNTLEAVLLSIDEYERLHACIENFENMEIERILQKRSKTPRSEYIDFEQVLTDHGIRNDDL